MSGSEDSRFGSPEEEPLLLMVEVLSALTCCGRCMVLLTDQTRLTGIDRLIESFHSFASEIIDAMRVSD